MITDWFQRWSRYQPEKTAVKEVDSGKAYTYRELNAAACRLAHYLQQEKQLRKGDRIVVLSSFRAEYFVLLGLAQKLGVILVPLNYRLSAPEIAYMVGNAKPSLILFEEQFTDLLSDVSAEQMSWQQLQEIVTESRAEVPEFNPVVVEESHPCLILYTSGTTGFPKGALYTHGMMLWNSLNTAIRLKITSDDRTLMVMPPFHTGGWNVLSTPLLHYGGTILLQPKFEAEAALKHLQQEEISIFMAVPTMVKMMMDAAEYPSTDFGKLRYLIVGGEALPIPVIEAWAARGVPIRQGYGLTEAGPNITSLEAEDAIRKRGSIGFPNFYVESRLVKENGNEALPGERGELWLKGPVVTLGYWQNKEATQKAFSDGWFKTGDILMQDEEGYLYVVDRIKNMFISGGENVYPAEIEKRLVLHPHVSEAVVVGVADARWGEVGKAFLVLKPGKTLDEEELKAFCCEGLARFKVPRHFVFLERLPKNDTGKIDRQKLGQMEVA